MPNLCDVRHIREVLARHGFRFSKQRGQNFLTDPSVAERMAESVKEDNAVLEIGPGFGALTAELCKNAGHVVAVEVDRLLLPVLRENLSACRNLTLVEGDALKLPLESLMPEGLEPVVCANLPYSVTSPLLARLLECEKFGGITVMVQREVAQRLCAAAGTPEYGAFTLFAGVYARPEILFEVPPDCFTPRPAVHSAVLRLSRHSHPVIPKEMRPLFLRVVKAAFAQRRKTLANALSAGLSLPRDTVVQCIESAGISPGVRGETLDGGQYLLLARSFAPVIAGKNAPRSAL